MPATRTSFDEAGVRGGLALGLSNTLLGNQTTPAGPVGANLDERLAGGMSFGTAFLKDAIARGKDFEARGENLRRRSEAGISNIGGRLARLRGGANLAVQEASSRPVGGPRGFSTALDMAVRRGKARQGIEARGEQAVRNQQLKDRIALVRQSLGKRGQIMQTSANAARIREGLAGAERNAAGQVGAAFSGAAGALAGGALRGFGDSLFDTSLGAGMAGQQSDVDSFLGAGPGGVGGIDVGLGGGFSFDTTGGTVLG